MAKQKKAQKEKKVQTNKEGQSQSNEKVQPQSEVQTNKESQSDDESQVTMNKIESLYLKAGESTIANVKYILGIIKENKKKLNSDELDKLDYIETIVSLASANLNDGSLFETKNTTKLFNTINGLLFKANSNVGVKKVKRTKVKVPKDDDVLRIEKYKPEDIQLSEEDEKNKQDIHDIIYKESQEDVLKQRNNKGFKQENAEKIDELISDRMNKHINDLKATVLLTLKTNGDYKSSMNKTVISEFIPQIEPNTKEILGYTQKELAVGFLPNEGIPTYITAISTNPNDYVYLNIGDTIDNGPVDLFTDIDRYGLAKKEERDKALKDEEAERAENGESEENEDDFKFNRARKTNYALNLKKKDNSFDKKWSISLELVEKKLLSKNDAANKENIQSEPENLLEKEIKKIVSSHIETFKSAIVNSNNINAINAILEDILKPYFREIIKKPSIDNATNSLSIIEGMEIIPDILEDGKYINYYNLIRRYDEFFNRTEKSQFGKQFFEKRYENDKEDVELSTYYEIYLKMKRDFNSNKAKGEYKIYPSATRLLMMFYDVKPKTSKEYHIDWAYTTIINDIKKLESLIYKIATSHVNDGSDDEHYNEVIKDINKTNDGNTNTNIKSGSKNNFTHIIKTIKKELDYNKPIKTSNGIVLLIGMYLSKIIGDDSNSLQNKQDGSDYTDILTDTFKNKLIQNTTYYKFKLHVDTNFITKVKDYKKYLTQADNTLSKARANISKYRDEVELAQDLLNQFAVSPAIITSKSFRQKLRKLDLDPDNITARNINDVLTNLINDSTIELNRTKEAIKYIIHNKNKVAEHYLKRDSDFNIGIVPKIPDRYTKSEKVDNFVKAKIYGGKHFMTVIVHYYDEKDDSIKEYRIPLTFNEQVKYRHDKGFVYDRGWIKQKNTDIDTVIDQKMMNMGFVESGKLWVTPEFLNKKNKRRINILITDDGKNLKFKTKGMTIADFYNYKVASGYMLLNNQWKYVTDDVNEDYITQIIGDIIDVDKYELHGDVWINKDIVDNIFTEHKVPYKEYTDDKLKYLNLKVTIGELYETLQRLNYKYEKGKWKKTSIKDKYIGDDKVKVIENTTKDGNKQDVLVKTRIKKPKYTLTEIVEDVLSNITERFMKEHKYLLFDNVWIKNTLNKVDKTKPEELEGFDFDMIDPVFDNE